MVDNFLECYHCPTAHKDFCALVDMDDTPMLAQFLGDDATSESTRQALRNIHPTGRIGTPQDVANLALWLASDEAQYASGQLWVLDGAVTAQVRQARM